MNPVTHTERTDDSVRPLLLDAVCADDHVLEQIVGDLHHTVALSDTGRLCIDVQQNVVSFGHVLDLIGETLLAPAVFLLDLTAVCLNELCELLDDGVCRFFLHRFHNKYDFVQSHEITSSLVYGRRFAAAELFFCERARNTHSRDKE